MPEHPTPPTSTSAVLPVPDWVPSSGVGLRIVPCGVHFDAVRVGGRWGAVALELLGHRSGPVLVDVKDGLLFWFVVPGGAVGWRVPVVVWGAACYVTVPAAALDPVRYVRWLVPPAGDCLTDAEALHSALVRAYAALYGPR